MPMHEDKNERLPKGSTPMLPAEDDAQAMADDKTQIHMPAAQETKTAPAVTSRMPAPVISTKKRKNKKAQVNGPVHVAALRPRL